MFLENAKRPPDRQLMSRNEVKEICAHVNIYSISSLFLLAVSKPDGFMNAVSSAGVPCESFGTMQVMDRKVFLTIIKAHQAAELGATLPPGGVGMVGTGSASSTTSGTSGTGSTTAAASVISVTVTTGASPVVGGMTTAPLIAYDLDNNLRKSLSEKTAAANSFSKFRAIWRLYEIWREFLSTKWVFG